MNNRLLHIAPWVAAIATTLASASFYAADATIPVLTHTDRRVARIEVGDPGYRLVLGPCASIQAASGGTGSPGFSVPAPPGVTLPYGLFKVEASGCNWNWGRYFNWGGLPPGTPPLTRRIYVEMDQPIPSGMVAWVYGPTRDNLLPHWREVPTGVSGRQAVFEVSHRNLPSDDPVEVRNRLDVIFTLGMQDQGLAIPGSFQGLWWAGPEENGWGMSITQHGSRIFVALFIYDAQRNPRWLVIPGGQWNTHRTVFTGAVYRPTGSPYAAGGNPAFSANASIGEATLTFHSRDSATLHFLIDGVAGSKEIRRQAFGPEKSRPSPRQDDLWWGGDGDPGWGFALAQQHDSYFGVWYTYDAAGETTWFVLPAGQWDASHTVYSGTLYRPRGAKWLGAVYNPHLLQAIPAGEASIYFLPEVGALQFLHGVAEPRPASLTLTRQPF